MAQYYTLPTAIGEAKIANAIALGSTITISELAIGDGGGTTPTPDSDRTSLVNQVRRAPINTSEVDPDNPNWIVVEQVLPPDIGGWTIREIGLFDADGDMIAYGNYPETYKPQLSEGSGRTQTIRFVMQVSDTAAVTLKVDPSIVLATRKYTDDSLAAHADSRNHPAATTTEKGMTQYATQQEHLDGQRSDRAAKPSGVKAAIDARIADQTTVNTGTDDEKFLTPKKLRWGVSYSLGESGYLMLPSWLGGLIIQWFRGQSSDQDETVTFPLAFPCECFNVSVTDIAQDLPSAIHGLGVDMLTRTDFVMRSERETGGLGTAFYCIALGV